MVAAQERSLPPSAAKYYAFSALLAASTASAALKAMKAPGQGVLAAARLLVGRQMAAATAADRAVGQMLADQGIEVAPGAQLNPVGFTTSLDNFSAMARATSDDAGFERLVASIMQDSARAAQQAAVTVRPEVKWVRHLSLPSCSRCAVLAGRVYRFSQGFKRHPGCDCVMIPVTVASPDLTYDPEQLARDGQVTGLSKADLRALKDGASFSQVVNVRLKSAGLTVSGQVLSRAGRLTPAGIFDQAGDDREYAVELLKKYAYIR